MIDFLNNDIQEKKDFLKELPLKTKRNKVSFNETLEQYANEYNEYKQVLLSKLKEKVDNFKIEEEEQDNKLFNRINFLKKDMFILNPDNIEYEKLGLDVNLYILKNFNQFSYEFLMETIENVITVFEKVGITLTKDDFFYNYYVNSFMSEFLSLRKTGGDYFYKLVPVFEKFYWKNPDLMYHIGINIRSIAEKHIWRIKRYIRLEQNRIKGAYNINDFDDCKSKLKEAYKIYKKKNDSVKDIYNLAEKGEIVIANYLENSKTRQETFNYLVLNKLKDEFDTNQFYTNLLKLKNDLELYIKYDEFRPLMNMFKDVYRENVVENKTPVSQKKLQSFVSQIDKQEKKIINIRKKYFRHKLFNIKSNSFTKEANRSSMECCENLNTIYNDFTFNYYIYNIKRLINNPVLIKDVLYIFYTYNSYKMECLNKIYPKITFEELKAKCDDFDSFALNPDNEFINNLQLFKDEELEKNIVTKHRLNNISITIEDIKGSAAIETLQKVNLLLRCKTLDESVIKAEDIQFVITAKNILKKENFEK